MLLAPVGGAPCGMWVPGPLEHPETLFRADRCRTTGLPDRRASGGRTHAATGFFNRRASGDSATRVEGRPIRRGGPGRDARPHAGRRSGPVPARGHPVAAPPRQPLHAQAGSPLPRVNPPGGGPKTKSGYGPRVGRHTGIIRPADPIGLIVGLIVGAPIRSPLPYRGTVDERTAPPSSHPGVSHPVRRRRL